MFQTIHDIDLKDRLRSKKTRNPWEHDLKPYHRHYYHARRRAKEQQESTIGITNLFILATAALETSFPKNSTTTSTGPATATQIIHAEIESISSHLSSLNDHIHTFNGPAIIQHLELFSEKLMHMGNHIASAAAEQQDMTATTTTTTTIMNDAKTSLTLIFYIKHALQPYNRETLFQLRKTKGRISRLGLLDDVTLALREVCEWMRVFGTVVMGLSFSSSSGGNHHHHRHHHHQLTHAEEKRRRWMVQGREVWEEIGRDWEEIVRYFEA